VLKQLRQEHISPAKNYTQPTPRVVSGVLTQGLSRAASPSPAGAPVDDLPGLARYKILYAIHHEVKKVFAYPAGAWWKDWKLWAGVLLWVGVLASRFLCPGAQQSAAFNFTSQFLYVFGINIVVLHLLTYASTPQHGLEITVALLVFQAIFETFQEFKAIGVALTIVLERVSYEDLVSPDKRAIYDELQEKIKKSIESDKGGSTAAKVHYITFKSGSADGESSRSPQAIKSVVVDVVVKSRASIEHLPDSGPFQKHLEGSVNSVNRIGEICPSMATVKDIGIEATVDDCVNKGSYECDTMYMDMTLPWFQILVLFVAQIGVWWFYFSSVLWNLNLDKINYAFWMASFVIMQVTMIFNRGDDSVLGNKFPIVEWSALIESRDRHPSFICSEDEFGPEPMHIGSLLMRGVMGYLCNTILREIMAFTIPLMLCSFVEPMDFVVYCVGVNFICTVDDMKEPKTFDVALDSTGKATDEELAAQLTRSRSSPSAF
jgi:hypothetical protein